MFRESFGFTVSFFDLLSGDENPIDWCCFWIENIPYIIQIAFLTVQRREFVVLKIVVGVDCVVPLGNVEPHVR
ncbi:hypothetical protein C477_05827 [Haloterrigena salina JCM 13891]|uniref:Uncharacterized protein n=1 Tax=Haloterrigena salina JCM 13891 TaxID=1227488 RepID=M0CEE3_9EURY|nr:hypothetical protein C477_05827 [Haloterrigena salina JCM 13891]